ELRYENSFGGVKFPANPVGKGFAEISDEAGGKFKPLPNIEDPAHLIEGRGDRPAPAGFGPLGKGWAARQGKLGTYKGAYRKTRWPWFPEDFDWTYFNAAPSDQQIEGYLRGDETLALENLHPQHPRYESQLPGLRVRCFVRRLNDGSQIETRFDELEMRLDTLWVDMEAEKLALVWRGWMAVSSEDHEEITDCFVMTEPLGQSPATLESCHRKFLEIEAAEETPFEPEAPPPPQPAQASEPAAADLAAEMEKEKLELKKRFEAQAAAFNAQFGLDKMPPAVRQQLLNSQAKLTEHLSETKPATSGQYDQLHAALGKIGLDPKNLPPLTDEARAEQMRLMSELGLDHPEFQSDPQLAGMTAILGAVVSKTAGNGKNLESVIAELRKLKEKLGWKTEPEPAPEPEEPKTVPGLTRESVQAGARA
ncbi:MAG: DUF2169 family type VI secretion system accessory protein, partial [Limisphaerales bacterium]